MGLHERWRRTDAAVRNLLFRKRKRYNQTFKDIDGDSPDGEWVLKDLAHTFGLSSNAFNPENQRITDYRLGQQSVLQYIFDEMEKSTEEIRAMTKDAPED